MGPHLAHARRLLAKAGVHVADGVDVELAADRIIDEIWAVQNRSEWDARCQEFSILESIDSNTMIVNATLSNDSEEIWNNKPRICP